VTVACLPIDGCGPGYALDATRKGESIELHMVQLAPDPDGAGFLVIDAWSGAISDPNAREFAALLNRLAGVPDDTADFVTVLKRLTDS
jgi:hypothetical protein